MSEDTQGQVAPVADKSAELQVDESKSAPADRSTAGPFDVSEVPAMRPHIDLGSIKIAPREGQEIRLEVDENQQQVVAVTVQFDESVLQLQAFAAPKSTGLWNRVRADITQQLQAQGATVREQEGPAGIELQAMSEVPEDQGGGMRAARFWGVDGPRWLLRANVLGKASVDAESCAKLAEVFRDIVVVRGENPLPPSELLPLKVPAGANLQQATN